MNNLSPPLNAAASDGLRELSETQAGTGGTPFLTGLHEPLGDEATLETLRVDGEIPLSLDGRYLRNGPNPAGAPDPSTYHWFAGAGMIHGIRISEGSAVWYRNRWIRGSEACAVLGEEVPPGRRSRAFDAPNTNVVQIGGRTFALVESGGTPAELGETLETIAHNPFDNTLSGPFTAHPRFDPVTGETHAITYGGGSLDKAWHVVLDANAHVIREEAIAVHGGPMIHDCAITASYVVVLDLPVTFSPEMLKAGSRFPYAWNEARTARVGLLPRKGRGEDIIWVPVDACFVFHPANAFDRPDGKVVVDLVAHQSMFATSRHGPDSASSQLERWTIDPAAGTTTREVLHPATQEFPRYDDRRTAQSYRYIYSVAIAGGDVARWDLADTRLFRHDLQEGTTITRDFGPNRHPGEFVFVPRSAQGAEDDGWLIGLVLDMNDETSELVILNADDFTGPPQAVVYLPRRIPPGFHGNWVPAAPV